MNKTLLAGLCAGLATVTSQGQLILNEDFNYADGAIEAVSGGLWTIHSGTTPLAIVGGKAFVDQDDATGGRMDANRLFGGATTFDPLTDNTSAIYASFTLNALALPTGTTTPASYFAHFKSSAANEFYSRVGANQEGAAAGKFRLAIANESWASASNVEHPMDLDLNTTYSVVMRLSLATDQSTLWINPVDESSTSVVTTDAISYAAAGLINSFALRQGTTGSTPNIGAPGDFLVDNLLVGLTFNDVVPIPEPGGILALGLAGLVGLQLWRRRK
jgi:hypothetical protein